MEDFRSFCQTYVIGFGPGAILFSASSSPFFRNPNVGNRSGCTEDSFFEKVDFGYREVRLEAIHVLVDTVYYIILHE